eukprot:jgi/Mesvir1/14945/Mv14621-RA.1
MAAQKSIYLSSTKFHGVVPRSFSADVLKARKTQNLPAVKAPFSVAASSSWNFKRRPLFKGLVGTFIGSLLLAKSPGSALAARYYGPTKNEVAEVLKNPGWPEEWPFKEDAFKRYDESPDSDFYSSPRFVTHIDDPAIAALTRWYAQNFPKSNTPGTAILDVCSSWISHFPKGYKQERIVGLGMNEPELKRNPVLTEYTVKDLNVDPTLPYEDGTFDVVVNAVSVDYLARPLEVFKEMNRVLKEGGLCAMSFSNRCFPTKVISLWAQTGDLDHIYIVGSYFHYAGGFEPPQVGYIMVGDNTVGNNIIGYDTVAYDIVGNSIVDSTAL